MRVYRRTRTQADGTKSQSKRWMIEWRDSNGRLFRLAAFTDRKASEEAARKIERLIGARLSHMQPDPNLIQWLELIPDSMRLKLSEWGIIDGKRTAATKPIDEHIADYETELQNRNRAKTHITATISRIRAVVEGCGIKTLSNLRADKVSAYLAKRRAEGLAVETSNHYTRAIRMFCKWLVEGERMSVNPMLSLRTNNASVDRRRVRRALSPDEAGRLIEATHSGPTRLGMSGPERGLLYRLGIETGLRANELRGLIRSDFDLVSESPSVMVRAANAKNKKNQRVPIREDTADLLRDYLRLIHPGKPVFSGSRKWGHIAAILRGDLERAREAWIAEAADDPDEWERRRESGFLTAENDTGEVVDFHSLRHTTASWLAASGVPITTAQKILRHSTITLTSDIYTHVGADILADGVARLPDFGRHHGRDTEQATGTDDKVLSGINHGVRHGARESRNHAISGNGKRRIEKRECESVIDGKPYKTREKLALRTQKHTHAGVAKLVDAMDSKSIALLPALNARSFIPTLVPLISTGSMSEDGRLDSSS